MGRSGEWIVADLGLGDTKNVADPVQPKDGPMGTSVEHLEGGQTTQPTVITNGDPSNEVGEIAGWRAAEVVVEGDGGGGSNGGRVDRDVGALDPPSEIR
jgi:hypothetical protein